MAGPSLRDPHVCSSTGDAEGPLQVGKLPEEAVLCLGATEVRSWLDPKEVDRKLCWQREARREG